MGISRLAISVDGWKLAVALANNGVMVFDLDHGTAPGGLWQVCMCTRAVCRWLCGSLQPQPAWLGRSPACTCLFRLHVACRASSCRQG